MQKKRPWLSLVIAGAATTAATVVSAAGFGAGGTAAVLGQALDFAVQVRLDAGEPLAPECVSAEVTVGERRLPAALVRTAVEPTGVDLARVRVITSVAIDEPVIGVLLSAECSGKLSRRFVVFADPPLSPVAVAPVLAAVLPEVPAGLDVVPTLPAGSTAGAAVAAPRGASVAANPQRADSPDRARGATRAAAKADGRAPQRRAAATKARGESSRRARRAAVVASAAVPRLKLELAEPVAMAEALAVDQALEAVAQAASAARAAASAASAASERIASLERTVEQLHAQAKDSRDLGVQWRERLGRAEDAARWLWPLFMAVFLLAGLTAWLAWRLSKAQRQQQDAWRQATALVRPPEPTPSRQLTRPIPFVTSELAQTDSALGHPRGTPAWPPPASVPADAWPASSPAPLAAGPQGPPAALQPADAQAMQRTDVVPPRLVSEDTAARDVSIEELIDLEQQAEFFVVLGQDEAAIDLLVEHLRHTGGGSPLPYLKLMEIYRRRGDPTDYERMRSRFNRRFNAYAPEWDVDLASGRTLEDYPGVVPRLQGVWARPLDAMAELEALLFRKSRGELFDLPAYREVLFLYSLARDLLDREAVESGSVDLLLPMNDGSEVGGASPAPYPGPEHVAGEPRQEPDDRPTAPLDFDLSAEAERPSSIFDLLQDPPPPTPRRR
ncbi:MAG: hypothetical protein Q8K96_08300 [Rubrivivax sp.]|nr:hypothetical protein [Rubrivivax sp.]